MWRVKRIAKSLCIATAPAKGGRGQDMASESPPGRKKKGGKIPPSISEPAVHGHDKGAGWDVSRGRERGLPVMFFFLPPLPCPKAGGGVLLMFLF